MTIAAPFLFIGAGVVIGWVIPAFGRHHFFGITMLIIAGLLLFFAFQGASLTVPKITVVRPSPSPSHSAPVSPSPVTGTSRNPDMLHRCSGIHRDNNTSLSSSQVQDIWFSARKRGFESRRGRNLGIMMRFRKFWRVNRTGAPGLAANECAGKNRGLRLLRSPLEVKWK